MALAFIGLGSNLGDGRINLLKAWRLLSGKPGIAALALSSPYLTRPVIKDEWVKQGKQLSGNWFTNAVGVLETELSPRELLKALQSVEKEMGRNRQKSVDRVADLDILYYNDLVLENEDLLVPHPEIQSRLFVLAPLEELAPDRIHPITGKTTSQMRRTLPISTGDDIRKQNWPGEN